MTALKIEEVDPNTPVIVGVGQVAERIEDTDYRGMSPIALAVAAARAAVLDTGTDERAVVAAIDTVACTRQFENSTPGAPAPLGKSTKFPISVANGLGATPRRAVLEVAGGQSPQHLVSEFGREIMTGTAEVVLLAGAEAISTIRHLTQSDPKPDFSDDPADPGGIFEDRGYGLFGLTTMEQASHGLISAPVQYALLENARRARRREGRAAYAAAMGALLAPFTAVAARNPLAAAPEKRTADELITVTGRNRMIADPYPRFLVSRDQVNQGAAILLMSVAAARRHGVDSPKWVFLHGQADLRERNLLERRDFGEAPSAPAAVEHALEIANVTLDEIGFFDLYSCFPIAVSNITDALGLSPDDPRGLTTTGGLPFFGGAGNNYSMHAIAEATGRLRDEPGSFALVAANGGVLSKTSVGVYSTAPTDLKCDHSDELQRAIDASECPVHVRHPHGWATIETYTVMHGRSGNTGVVIGRLVDGGGRFLSQVAAEDGELLTLLEEAPQPIGERVFVSAFGYGNRVTLDEVTATRLFAKPPPKLRDDYEFVRVLRDGHLLEVTINRPDARNCLHPPAHEELDQVFDAFFADPELWVAIISGEGTQAFCAGNDLLYSVSGKPMYVPLNGFAGLTSRRDMNKPVIAAVNGFAMGGGFEIALACHLVVADESAKFALSEVKVGLIAGAGGLIRLPRAIPQKIANDLILTGRRIGADEAQRLGVVSRIAPEGEALRTARELADDILGGSPTSVRLSLELMERTQGIADCVDAVTAPSDVVDELMTSADAIEGMTAFAMKRPPEWKNM
ncbi:acetyl-CoA acetyltransferase [Mycobacterium sp. CVI_P3]|uniref:Acetyl-CoA acetyltransferase n=1 Tax=Mycobacterium pinniadriaticum TaxID=2994102 RepID=A0ABT3SIC9_9MYCO|nr:acetyl-CoA acetyltransferase [Mycobacterium pinniadriaticum]MCX2932298.1 acetyl-CoA acetyltransferase [Mycobacterium pinniadriaticum]MCX2938602.1 acetyl-CoA acetyltransferase [Mycobacterium pinniadriaticum]